MKPLVLIKDRRFFDVLNQYNLIRIVVGDLLTVEQYTTMGHIHKFGSCFSTQLATEFGVNKSAITSIINRLVERQLVERNNDPNDRRTIYLSLTDDGKDLFLRLDRKLRELVQPVIYMIIKRK
ncbi:MarR family winged helix-turn-helix transcriptional regulator [Paenibacillus amylolyticus]|uniref:MarR family winged helix-turn-helix transcriptional regulator n=1 Tax=Paenibacillus amylolyticus TaxID=1451 RepID=UPI001428C6C3|nr:MarR family transcriptional regulator [Paenibacillus amylolyticus]